MWQERTLLAACLAGVAGVAAAEPETWAFEWQGSGGYAVRGALSYDSAAVEGPFVVEGDVTCFVIEGTKDGAAVGRWALGQLNEQTSWRLHFDPAGGSFVVDGEGIWMPQAWNMNGEGTDCGAGGFGFNIGNAAQDICLDNSLVVDSQVLPTQAFPAVRVARYDFPGDACTGPALLSLLR
ncbi:hypothetical protein [Maliponia aquimaris]|uniref:Uncharacterized protein n=1 Tax=Maliponia aquimaris TaxID=1673631 RepID=A0A238K816_9RHOB|nr:hypothetical protein [Maliponia aquimaris]SMX39038.1 hypothetical protein MAA8898_01848 [Maliponia aquimaris]